MEYFFYFLFFIFILLLNYFPWATCLLPNKLTNERQKVKLHFQQKTFRCYMNNGDILLFYYYSLYTISFKNPFIFLITP